MRMQGCPLHTAKAVLMLPSPHPPYHCAAAARPGEPPLWGIPVTAAAGEPPEPPLPPRPVHSLQEALQQLLDQAAEAGGDAEAIGAIAQVAADMAAMEDEVMAAAEEEEAEEEGSGSEEEAGLTGARLDGLQQQVVADQMAAVAAPLGGLFLQAAASAHSARVGSSDPFAVLWSLLGAGLAQWEVAHRDPAGERGLGAGVAAA